MKTKENTLKKRNFSNFIFLIIRLICILVIIYSLIYIYNWYKYNKSNDDIIKNVQSAIIELPSTTTIEESNLEKPKFYIDFDLLKSQNPQTVGWIIVNNTKINYPIVQANNNNFYLTHSFNNTYNSAGWIFADYRVPFENLDFNTIVYGHNMINKTMFGSLMHCEKPEWYNNPDNQNIIMTNTTNYMEWQIFSIYETKPETYYLSTNFSTIEDKQNFINTLKSRSINNFNVEVLPEDNILTLSTCTNYMDKRLVIHAKLVKSQPLYKNLSLYKNPLE